MLKAHLRIARPTDHLNATVDMYRRGRGFELLSTFEGHSGFDGATLGHRGSRYHLEFTSEAGVSTGPAPTADHLLVFYEPDGASWRVACERMEAAGFEPVASHNPYWDERGRTFADLDGYRVVLECAAWTRQGTTSS